MIFGDALYITLSCLPLTDIYSLSMKLVLYTIAKNNQKYLYWDGVRSLFSVYGSGSASLVDGTSPRTLLRFSPGT